MSITRSFSSRGERGKPPPVEQVRIEGYQVHRLIGVGRLTAVYEGVLESHQQPVALKVLLPHLAASEAFVQRFLQAASAARMVNHEHVLPCWDVGTSGGLVYLATELCRGSTLAQHLLSGPLEGTRAIWIAWQCTRALEAIHQAGLVHGDVRPENVLLDPEDGVRLADTGLPRIQADAEDQRGSSYFRPAPVTGDSGQPDARYDTYAIGALITAMVTGRHQAPAAGQNHATLLPQTTDPNLSAVVAKATATRPEDRYRHAWQLREDLERVQHEFAPIHALNATTSSDTIRLADAVRASTVPRQSQVAVHPDRRWLWIGSAAVVAILLGVAVIAGSSGPRPQPAKAAPPLVVAAPPPAKAAPEEPKPEWAGMAGQDAIGRWAEIVIGQQRHRLRLVKPGSYWIGSAVEEPNHVADEERHLVTISHAYWLGVTEVPQSFWRAAIGTPSASHFIGDDLPVESVSWEDCQVFLAALNHACGAAVRLPTEAEWEYACRAGGSGGVPTATQAWTADAAPDPPKTTRAVGTLAANAWGIHDMQGNVMEWCEDSYGRYPREASTDPLATGGIHRVIRGGAWNIGAVDARAAARGKALPTTRQFHVGLRIAVGF